jgi:hypothetical protein
MELNDFIVKLKDLQAALARPKKPIPATCIALHVAGIGLGTIDEKEPASDMSADAGYA